jgi:hypothetical protein
MNVASTSERGDNGTLRLGVLSELTIALPFPWRWQAITPATSIPQWSV